MQNVTDLAGPAFSQHYAARGLAVGDLNNDGDPDIVFTEVLKDDGSGFGHYFGRTPAVLRLQATHVSIPDDFGRLPREMELVMFRLVQECLTNIHRHSGSKSAEIHIARNGDSVCLEVQDEGKGISSQKLAAMQSQSSGVGIRGMRERVRQFEGDMNIESDEIPSITHRS